MSVAAITADNFDRDVMNNKNTVLLDFFAAWCGPCRMLSPIVDEIAEENPDIFVGKVNVDEQKELAARFGVSSIPSLFVFKDGKVVNQSVGVKPKKLILSMLGK